jgi:hypothetical protein
MNFYLINVKFNLKKNQTLQKYFKYQLDSVDKLYHKETILKTELKLTRNMIKKIPVY